VTPTVEWHEVLDSTQDRAHALAEAGAPAGTAVAAHRMARGRGTRGRAWEAPAGGLWISVVTRPAEADAVERLSLRVGLALAERIEVAAGPNAGRIAVKWPNDLVARDRKLGGVLCEARWTGDRPGWVVVGVGVNVDNPLPPALERLAIRLADLGWRAGPAALAPVVVEAVLAAAARTGLLGSAELAAWADRDWLRGRELAGAAAGRVVGITPAGRLLVATPGGGVREVLEPLAWSDLAPSAGSR
jgi:BirA family transcriptional regulator, biotin operon repressor / biotin---[acetyl-CoA-carboxylase] ligase